VPTYGYRCDECGPFEVRHTLREPTRTVERCPRCAEAAGRVFGAPALRGMAPSVRRALDVHERSAHQPSVVSAVPPSRRATPVTTDPRHARLPRP
jgi:putative FmdB family regulatory protein